MNLDCCTNYLFCNLVYFHRVFFVFSPNQSLQTLCLCGEENITETNFVTKTDFFQLNFLLFSSFIFLCELCVSAVN